MSDLLASAETEADALAALDLIAEEESRHSGAGRYTVATLRDVAEFFGVQEQTCRQWKMRPGGMPGEAGRWPLDEIAKWLTRWRETPEKEKPSEPKPMDVVKHRLAELDLAEREKRLVDVSEVVVWMGRVAGVIRDGITVLEQRHGTEAAEVMRTPLERMRREVESHAAE